MAGIGKRMLLRDINQHLICLLCRGYLIDATTVVECLHSFCRSCILKHLSTSAQCPSCKHVLNKAKPNIKADKTLQEIVYKLVPGLYHREMLKRREFYKKHPEHANLTTPEQRGEDVSGRLIFNPEDVVSLSLEYLPPEADPLDILSINDTDMSNSNSVNSCGNTNNSNHNGNTGNSRRYLQCPALVTIAHLKKFISMKYSVDLTRYTIEICHRRATLPENWTLMDVAYIYAWKRIAPMRFFYLVAHEQRLEAPLHQRPSTPGLGARDCLPPSDIRNNSDINSNPVNQIPETSKSEVKSASDSDRTTSLTKNLTKIASKVNTPVDCKPTVSSKKDETSKTTTMSATSSTLTVTSTTTTILTTVATNMSSSTTTTTTTIPTTTTTPTTPTTTTMPKPKPTTTTTPMPTTMLTTPTTTTTTTTFNDSNKQIKSPIKIMKNPDGKYEVLKNPSTPSTVTNIKSPTSPEFSVVNSNGVKITLKQCSPPQNNNAKKPKVISDVLLRCGQIEKDMPSSGALIQRLQQQQDKDKFTTTVLPDKLEKQRRKVTFSVDRPPTSEKTSPTNASGTVPKTALKKPAEQQDKKQFLQGFQLTAREPSVPNDNKLIPTIRDIGAAVNALKSLQKNNAKVEESSKKDTEDIKKKSNTENAGSNANGNTIATNAVAKRNLLGMTANSRANKTNDANGRALNSGVGSNSTNIASSNHLAAKMDVYTFPSDPPIVGGTVLAVKFGAVKRKCPPGVPIADLKRRKSSQIAQRQESNKRQNVSPYNSAKLSRTSSAEHVIPTSRATNISGDYGGSSSRVSNAKASTSPVLSNDTRDFLVDGYGLNIPASLSITLTSPKSPGVSGQLVESKDSSDNNRGKVALGKVNPSITLNDRSVDPRVLKALKTGQIRMPATPAKAKPAAATTATTKQTPMTTDRSETATNPQRTTTFAGKRKKEHELSRDILDLSGGKKNIDLHPLRIPQPVTKLNQNKTNKITGKDNVQPGSISDQGQLVTLGNHLYYRAPPGSLTPAAHRVNDFPLPPSPSRTPVYAPCLGSINRSNLDFSSAFPTLSSFYALNQAPNLQQFHMDTARLKLPPRSIAESGAISASSGSGDNPVNPSISGIPGKTHLAAQCAPVKPARSSVAPLAVPINKQQQSADKSANVNANRMNLGDSSSKPSAFRNNESHVSADETVRLNVQKRFSSNVESTNNRFLSRNEDVKSTSQATNETAADTKTEPRKEMINPDNSMQQRQQQQNREAASPNIVSSTASPSPPPGSGGARNESNTNHGDNNINSSNGGNNGTSSSPTKSIASEATCNKSPDSPDSSSITVECSSGTSSGKTTDREMSTDETKTPDTNPTVNDSTASDDKNKFAIKPEVSEIAKQLTSVQKTLLAVFPSNEWANNPIAAEHLGNFLKSLNATIKSEESADESKAEKTDRKTESNENR